MGSEPTVNQAIGGILARLLFPAADEFGKTLGEKSRAWIQANLKAVTSEADAIAKDAGVTEENKKEIPFGILLSATEAASHEDEPDIQKMWAQLLVNSINPAKDIGISKMHITLLKEFGPLEAKFLHLLSQLYENSIFKKPEDLQVFRTTMGERAEAEWRIFPEAARSVAIQNLTRLRCITFRANFIDISGLLVPLDPKIFGNSARDYGVIHHARLQQILQKLVDLTMIAGGGKEPNDREAIPLISNSGFQRKVGEINFPEMNYQLTAIGRDLLQACSK